MNTILNKLVGLPSVGRAFAVSGLKLALISGFGLVASLAAAQPANDNFTNATVIAGSSGTINGSNVGATLEVGELTSVLTTDYGPEPVASSVWYAWSNTVSGPVTFSTVGSAFDTLLAVYTNNGGAIALTNLGLVTAEEDIGGNNGWVYQSQVTFTAATNTIYYLSVNTSVFGQDNTGSVKLNWSSANTNVPTIPSGTFLFTTTNYTVSDAESSGVTNPAMNAVPPWPGARVTVTRTNGASGRVLVPYTVKGDASQTSALANTNGILVFDDYQMSADIPVPILPIPANGSGFAPPAQITVKLGTPTLDPLESPDLIPPAVAGGSASNSTITVLSDTLQTGATPTYFNIEQKNLRVRRTQGNAVVRVYISALPPSGTTYSVQYALDKFVSLTSITADNNNRFQLQADSDYAITNADFSDISGGTLSWGSTDPNYKDITIPIINNKSAAFNEDFEIELYNPITSSGATLALGQVNKATVTILYDKQPAGAVDRTWNKDGFNDSNPAFLQYPGALGGEVYAAVEQPDGKAIIAGSFNAFDSQPYNHIARLLNNGYQDTTFLVSPNSGANGSILALALYPAGSTNFGKILIGGNFTAFNGTSRFHLARLNANGSLDTSFNPGSGANGSIAALAVETNGQVVIGGDFTSYNGTNMINVARVNANGGLDTTFNPGLGPNSGVNAVAVDNSGRVIIGGGFDHVAGLVRGGVARLKIDGTVDPTFDPGIGTYNPVTGGTDPVYALALQANGQILVGGAFAYLEMTAINGLGRFNVDGTVDTTFGTFGTVNGTYNWQTGVSDSVNVITLQPDGTILIGGDFMNINQTRRVGIARLFTDGSLDTSFMDTAYNQFAGVINHYHNPNAVNTNDYPAVNTRNVVNAIAVEPGTTNVIIGGSFLRAGGGSYPHAYSDPLSIFWAPSDGIYGEDQAAEHGIIFNGRMDIHPRSNVARLIGGGTVGPGNIEFAQSGYTVTKNSGTLNVALIRTNGNLGAIGANFYSPPGAAGQQGIATSGTNFIIGNASPVWDTQWFSSWMYSTGFQGPSYDIFTPGDNANEILTIQNNTNVTGNLNANLALTTPNGTLFMYLGGELIPLGAALGTLQTSPLTIIDPNYLAGVLAFSSPTYTVNANGTNAVITVTRTNFTGGVVQVNYATSDGTATNGLNYTATSGTLNFAASDSFQTFTIPILAGSRTQPDRTVNLVLSTPTGGAALGQRTAVLTIVNNYNGNMHLGFVSATNIVSETAGTALIGVNRLGNSSGTVTVTVLTSNGTATNGINYTGTTNVLTWNDGDVSAKTISVPVKHDGLFTSNLTVNLSLTNATLNSTNYPASLSYGGTNAVLLITNVDFPGMVEFTATNYSVKKFGGYAVVPVIRTGGSAGTVTVGFSTANNTAVNGTDYTGTNGILTFNNGQVFQSFKVPITPTAADGFVALNLVLTNALAVGSPTWIAQGSPSNAVLNIIDTGSINEPPGSPDTSYSPLSGFNAPIYALALQTNNQLIVGGDFTMANGTYRQRLARINDNGTLDASFLLPSSSFGADNSVRALAIQSDGRILVGGYFTNLNNTVVNSIGRLNYDGSLDSSFNTGSGADNPVLALAQTFVNGNAEILVGGSFAHLGGVLANGIGRLTGSGVPDPGFNTGSGANGTVYALAVQTDGRVVIGGDFTMVNGVPVSYIARLNTDGSVDLTFTNGLVSAPVRALAIQLDGQILAGGLFTSVNGNPNYKHIVRLNSADGSPDSSFNPGLGANNLVLSIALQTDGRMVVGGTFTSASGVTRNRITRLNTDGTVDPTINFGVGADDFVAAIAVEESANVNFPPGVPDEKIIIGGGFLNYDGQSHPYLARIYGGSIGGSGSFEFSSAAYSVNENGTNVVITINRTGGTSGTNADGSGNIYVNFATTNGGTAQPGTNYTSVVTNLTFAEGEVQQTVTIPVVDDQVITSNLTVNLALTPVAPAAYGDQPTAVLTIVNVDSAISFSTATYVADKFGTNVPNGFASIYVSRLGAAYGTSTVVFNTTTNGTATPGVDYQPQTNVLVTFAPGVAVQTVFIPVINGLSDGNQTVSLQLSNVTGSVLYSPSNALLTIVDDTLASGSLEFSASNYVVSEGGGVGYVSNIVTVLRTNGSSGILTVNYATADGTALAGVKYVSTSGILTFGDGQMSQTFAVPVINTATVEPTEYFSVLLSNPSGGTGLVNPSNATVTILNTNTGIAFTAATNTFIETAGIANLNVVRYNNTNSTVTVNYSTTNGTALAGTNYQATTGTLTFGPNVQLAAIQIPLIYDTNVTGPLQFTVGLSSPTSAAIGTPGTSTVILQDADTALSFNTNSSSVFKNAGTAVFTVTCSNTNVEPVSVSYATTNGTAIAGADYTATSGTLTFSNGSSALAFSVPIINNSVVAGSHWFSVSLSNPTGPGRLVPPTTQTNVIIDSNSGLNFSSAAYTALKTGGTAVITVNRSDYTGTNTTVNFVATNGTAVNGLNFVATNGTLVFSNGATTSSFVVQVINTPVVQPELTVLLQLSNPTNGILLAPSSATLNIQDNSGSYIIPAGAQMVTNYTSLTDYTNGIIGTNDTVQVLFAFRDAPGNGNVNNLVATLLATNGVTPVGPATTNYGPLINGGHSVSRPFTFTARGTNQQVIAATFMLQDGANYLDTNVFFFTLGSWTSVFSNSAAIVINDNTNASPYPSIINVSQVGGSLIKATVTLNKLSHTYPHDVDALVVSPAQLNTLIMAHVGGGNSVTNLVLTFDDASTNVLSANGRITTGTNQPTQNFPVRNFP